jgi:hypothetical protein
MATTGGSYPLSLLLHYKAFGSFLSFKRIPAYFFKSHFLVGFPENLFKPAGFLAYKGVPALVFRKHWVPFIR